DSAASGCRGLIEARRGRGSMTGLRRYSAASGCRGLIEASASKVLAATITVIPRHQDAAASLKRRKPGSNVAWLVRIPRHQDAAASLKHCSCLHILALLNIPRHQDAAASLKLQGRARLAPAVAHSAA